MKKEKKVQLCIFVTEEEKEKIKSIANSYNISQTTVVRFAIQMFHENLLCKSDI